MRSLARNLDKEGIVYTILGGLALAEHGYPRRMKDIDLLMTADGLELFRQKSLEKGYRLALKGPQ